MRSTFTFLFLLFTLLGYSQSFDIYVSDAGNFNNPPWQILKFDHQGQNPSTFISTHLNWPQDILFFEDSNTVIISNLGTNNITKHNASTGAYISDFANQISGPTRMKVGPDSLLYVLQWRGNGKVKRFQLDGTYIDDFTAIGVPQSIGLDWDSDGNLYVSSYNGDLVRKFDTAGADSGVFINSNLAGPTNIWFDSNGDLLVADYDGTAVKRFDAQGNYLGDFCSGLSQSEGVAYMPNGNILVGDGASHSVKMFDPNGNYINDIITNGSGNLITPNAVVIRKFNNVSDEEEVEMDVDLVYPSIGAEFTINLNHHTDISALEVYNTSGQLIKKLDINTQSFWQADQYAEGIYVVLAYAKGKSLLTQKIEVRR